VLRVRLGVVYSCQQIGEAIAIGFDEQDLRTGSDGVRPFDVERNLQRPAAIRARVARAAALVDLLEAAVGRGAGGQAILLAEDVEVTLDRRVVVGIDDGDGLAGAGSEA